MKSLVKNVNQYITALPQERKSAFIKLRETILNTIPEGFL